MALHRSDLNKSDAEMVAVPARLASPAGLPEDERRRPVPNGLLGVAIFLGTEAMLFAALISAYLILRAGSTGWPPPGQPRLPVEITAVNSVFLLASGYTMWRALRATEAPQRAACVRWLALTLLLGATFLLIQGGEWVRLLGDGLHASASVYAATFYAVIGCHGLHVLAAVITLAVITLRAARVTARASLRSQLEACRLYWLFVVAVWPILYVLVYLA